MCWARLRAEIAQRQSEVSVCVCVFGGGLKQEKELATRALDHSQQRRSSLTHQLWSETCFMSACQRGVADLCGRSATLRDQPLRNYSHDRDDFSVSSVQWLVCRMWGRLGLLLFNSPGFTGAIIRAYIMWWDSQGQLVLLFTVPTVTVCTTAKCLAWERSHISPVSAYA